MQRDSIPADQLAAVTGGGAFQIGPLPAGGPRKPPQTPGVPRVGFEQCITCGPARWAAEYRR
jgi:hypothetical protein